MTTDSNATGREKMFAERQGWKRHYTDTGVWVDPSGNRRRECEAPNPTDRNHVHVALRGMTEQQWFMFIIKVRAKIGDESDAFVIMERVFKLPLTIVVEAYLEATKA